MMSMKQSKPRLSKAILDMKFMQRTKNKVQQEMEDAEGRAMYSNEITERMLNSNSNFIMEPSFIRCEDLIEGRLSFRGMNPEIERLLELEQEEREAEQGRVQKTEVSDTEMLAFYYAQQAPTATKSMQKKFQNKRKINNHNESGKAQADDQKNKAKHKKKTKFLKPREEDYF